MQTFAGINKEDKMISTGFIQQVSQKEGKYGIKIADKWFNGFGTAPGIEGDSIEFEYEESPDKVDPVKIWYRVKKIIKINELNLEVKEADKFPEKEIERLDKDRIYADLMLKSTEIWIKRNLGEDLEIYARFLRMCDWLGLNPPAPKIDEEAKNMHSRWIHE